MYYTIYKITNQINGKIYIGSHKTNDLDDDYMGSGKYLKYAQEKYGIENFTKEILFVFDNPDDMYAKEAEIVNEEFISEQNTYNIKVGGFGGFDYINKTGKNLYGRNGQSGYGLENLEKSRSVRQFRMKFDHKYRSEICEKISEGLKQKYASGFTPPFKGKSHTDETKRKIGEANSKHQSGKGNSQYGTRWIHSLEEKRSKKIKKDEPIPEGWFSGRKMKF